jgi:hypothetical protein
LTTAFKIPNVFCCSEHYCTEEAKKEGKDFGQLGPSERPLNSKNKDVTAVTTLMETVDRMAGLLTEYAVDTSLSRATTKSLSLTGGMLLALPRTCGCLYS